MFKWAAAILLLVGLIGAGYVALNIKPLAMKEIKKQISAATGFKTVMLKDLSLPLKGPIVLSGLDIKNGSGIDIRIARITLDRGVWSLFGGSDGKVEIKSAALNQIKFTDLKIDFWWNKKDLILHIMDGRILKGTIKGDIILKLVQAPSYQAKITIEGISLPSVINDFKLKEKVSISGLINGAIEVHGSGKTFSLINGQLGNTAVTEGGELIIEDTQFLKQMVKSMKLDKITGSEELFVASLKHYPYNKLNATLNLVNGDLILNAVLEGETGKRSFPIVYHDFTLERLGL
jgi:hypothetical protein